MKLTKRQFNSMKKRAKKAGACREEMRIINRITLEKFLAHDEFHRWIRWYYRNVLRNAVWPEGEDSILIHSYSAYCYAINSLGRRWIRYENACLKAINNNDRGRGSPLLWWWTDYLDYFDLELVDA